MARIQGRPLATPFTNKRDPSYKSSFELYTPEACLKTFFARPLGDHAAVTHADDAIHTCGQHLAVGHHDEGQVAFGMQAIE